MLGTVYDNTLVPTTLNVEQTVVADETSGIYVCQVDLSAMLGGDAVEFRAKMKVRSGGALVLCEAVDTYSGAPTVPGKHRLFGFREILALYHFALTIKQTTGTLRSYPIVVAKIG